MSTELTGARKRSRYPRAVPPSGSGSGFLSSSEPVLPSGSSSGLVGREFFQKGIAMWGYMLRLDWLKQQARLLVESGHEMVDICNGVVYVDLAESGMDTRDNDVANVLSGWDRATVIVVRTKEGQIAQRYGEQYSVWVSFKHRESVDVKDFLPPEFSERQDVICNDTYMWDICYKTNVAEVTPEVGEQHVLPALRERFA